MKKWPIEMWVAMFAFAALMIGLPLAFWVVNGPVKEIVFCLVFGFVVLVFLSKMVQKSFVLAIYAGIIDVIMFCSVSGLTPAALVVSIVIFGLFFVAYGFMVRNERV